MTPVQRSLFFSAVERYAGLVLFFFSTAILARLLSPKEFGVYAVVTALMSVTTAAFQEFGGANYLIQKPVLSRENIRSAFTVFFAISAVLAIIMYLLAPAAARFFGQEELRIGVEVSAANSLLAPIAGTLTALRRREMAFGVLAICNLASGAVGIVATVALALMHFSYMAPIWGGVLSSLVLTLLLLAARPDLGIFRPSLAEFRDVFRFGAYSGGVVLINVFYNFAPQLFLARTLGFSSVGLYSRAGNITQVFDRMVTQVLNPVVMPAIAASKAAGQDLRLVYLNAAQLLLVVQWPALLFVAIEARSIILIWLGDAWTDIVPLVQLLCVGNMALFAACLSYPVLVALGKVRDAFVLSFVSLPPSLLVVFFASFFGVEAVAASALATLPFQAGVALYFITRRLRISWVELARSLVGSVLVTAATAAGVELCVQICSMRSVGPLFELLCATAAAAVCWLLGLAITGHPLLAHIRRIAGSLAVAPRPRELDLLRAEKLKG